MSKPLLLGEAPAKSGDAYWQFPLSGRSGKVLHELAGLKVDPGGSEYGRYYWPLRSAYDCRNVIARYPGPDGRGAAFPHDQALAGLAWLWQEGMLCEGRVVVMLGRRVMRCMVGGRLEFYRWAKLRKTGLIVAGIPHPSGLTRLYNDPGERARAGKILTGAIKRAEKSGG